MKKILIIFIITCYSFTSNANNLKALLETGKVNKDSNWETLIENYSYPLGTNKETQFKNLNSCRYIFKADSSYYGVQVPIEFFTDYKEGVQYAFWTGFRIYDAYRLVDRDLNIFINKYFGGNHAYDIINKKIDAADQLFGKPEKTEKLNDLKKRNRYFDEQNHILLILDYYTETGAICQTQVLYTNSIKSNLPEKRVYPYEQNAKYIVLAGKKYSFKFAALNRKFEYDKVGNAGEKYSFEEYGKLYISAYAYDNAQYPYALDGNIYSDAKMYHDTVENLKEVRYEINHGYKNEVKYILKREGGRKAYCYKILGVLKQREKAQFSNRVWAEVTLYFYSDRQDREQIAQDFFDSFEIWD